MDTQTVTLTDFLLARIAEDEHAARAVKPLETVYVMGVEAHDQKWGHLRHTVATEDGYPRTLGDPGAAAHFARHEPARVLAECEAKRRIVALHDGGSDKSHGRWVNRTGCTCGDMPPCRTLAALALPYADHPDYRAEWRP